MRSGRFEGGSRGIRTLKVHVGCSHSARWHSHACMGGIRTHSQMSCISHAKLGLPKKVKCVSSRHSCSSRQARGAAMTACAWRMHRIPAARRGCCSEQMTWHSCWTAASFLGACRAPDLWHALELKPPVVVQKLERQHTRPRRQPCCKVDSQQRPRDRRQRVVPVHCAAAAASENGEAADM